MKKTAMSAIVLSLLIFTVSLFVCAEGISFDNSGFESTAEPREGELFFGWKAFVAGATNASIVTEEATEGTHSLKLVGLDGSYVGVRSVHLPAKPGKAYTVSLKALIKEMGDPANFQVWMEFWPKDYPAETSTYRLAYPRVKGEVTGSWSSMSVTEVAPPNTDSLTVLIIIYKVPGLVYVDDVQVKEG